VKHINAVLSLVGYVSAVTGVGLNWGVGDALLIGGVVLFVAGGLASSRESRVP
jgi:hypothetical protein